MPDRKAALWWHRWMVDQWNRERLRSAAYIRAVRDSGRQRGAPVHRKLGRGPDG